MFKELPSIPAKSSGSGSSGSSSGSSSSSSGGISSTITSCHLCKLLCCVVLCCVVLCCVVLFFLSFRFVSLLPRVLFWLVHFVVASAAGADCFRDDPIELRMAHVLSCTIILPLF